MKKSFVILVLLGCAVLVFGGGGREAAPDAVRPVVMRIATIEPSQNLGAVAVDRFGEIMKERTDGGFVVDSYHDSQLGGTDRLLEQVQTGALQAWRGSISALGRLKGDMVIAEFIYLFDNAEEAETIIRGDTIGAINEAIADEFGIKFVTASWTRLPRHIISKNPVTNIDELRGMLIRVPDARAYIESFRHMGAVPTPVAFTETYLALRQGVVDGAENHIESLYNMKWHEVAHHVALTYHSFDTTGFVVNVDWWNSLSEEYKELFLEVDAEVNEWWVEQQDDIVDDYMEKMRVEQGVEFHTVDVDSFRERVIPDAAMAVEAAGFWSEGLFEKVLDELRELRN